MKSKNTCCPRSVNVEKFVVEVIQLLDRVWERIRVRIHDFGVEIRHSSHRRGLRSGNEQLEAGIDLSRNLLNGFAKFRPVNQGCGGRGTNGVQQRLAGQVVVNECRDETELGAAQP